MKQDYQDFEIKLNMKTIMLFEKMSGKSFYDLDDEDTTLLVYCSLVVNNNQKVTFSTFQQILKNERIARTLMAKCQGELDFISQFNKTTASEDKSEDKTETDNEDNTLTSIINSLILSNSLDINYVMNDMSIWEISVLSKSIEEKTKADLVEKRFWAYLNICPHIDTKKIKGPEQLLPFPWEKESKKEESIKFMDNNRDAIMAFFNRNKDNE